MKNFVCYLDNGQIVKTGYCLEEDLYLQGSNVIEGFADDSTQYVFNGQIIDLPSKPDGECFFDYETKQWVLDNSKQEILIKQKRNNLLSNSDWTQITNNPFTSEQQETWAVYRQELRDVSSQSGYPFNVIWPTPPQG